MTSVTLAWLELASRQNRLAKRLGPLADFLLARDLTGHESGLSETGTCLLLYDNAKDESGTGGVRVEHLPPGYSLPVRWSKKERGSDEVDDVALPPDVLRTAEYVRQVLATDGQDALPIAHQYVLKRLQAHEGYSLATADLLFSGDSCALPLATGLVSLIHGGRSRPGLVMSGKVHAGRLQAIQVGGKAHVLKTFGLKDSQLVVTHGSHVPAGVEVSTLPRFVAGSTLRAQMSEVLVSMATEPAKGDTNAWLDYLNSDSGRLIYHAKRSQLFEAHLVPDLAKRHTWKQLNGALIDREAVVGADRRRPLVMCWNQRNVALAEHLAQSYLPSEICVLTDISDGRAPDLDRAPSFSGVPITVVAHDERKLDWATVRGALHAWMAARVNCNVELLPGSQLMSAVLADAAAGTSARVYSGVPPQRGNHDRLTFAPIVSYLLPARD